jgi:hypothetical protein
VLGAYGLTSPEGERGIHYRALQRAVRGAAGVGELEAYRSAFTHTGDPPCRYRALRLTRAVCGAAAAPRVSVSARKPCGPLSVSQPLGLKYFGAAMG